MYTKPAHRRAFRFLETALAVAFVAMLAGVLSPVVSSQIEDANQGRALGDMDVLAKAFTTFRTQTSIWPYSGNFPVAVSEMATGHDDLIDFRCLYSNLHQLRGWKGPYLNFGVEIADSMRVAKAPSIKTAGEGLLDPWGQPYRVYRIVPQGGDIGMVALLCRGPDGTVNSSVSDVEAGAPSGDDLLRIVSRRL